MVEVASGHTFRSLLVAVAAALAFTGCNADGPVAGTSDELTTLSTMPDDPHAAVKAERSMWDELAVSDYRLVYELRLNTAAGAQPANGVYEFTVRDGSIVKCLQDGEPRFTWPCDRSRGDPVDRLFRSVIDNPVEWYDVGFDERFHIPVFIDFDRPDAADDEYVLRVHEIQPLSD